MARLYTVNFEAVSVSAVQDLIQIIGASGKILKIRGVKVGATNTTIPTAQMLDLRCRFLPATVTNGSGGSSPTPQKLDPGDAAASFTAKANNTTQATTSGTAVLLFTWGVHIYAGLDVQFASDQCPVVGPSESFTFELQSTVTGTVSLSGQVTVEELGG